jgi:hypothetical protein
MSDAFGLGDGPRDLSTARAEADAAVTDARRPRPDRIASGRWPSVGAVVRFTVVVAGAIVVIGWLLTAINAPS